MWRLTMDRNNARSPCAVAPPHVKRNGEFVMNAKRVVLRIQLDQGAKEHLDRLSRTLGMTKLAAPLAREVLEELAGQQQAGPSQRSRSDAES
jgi:hypothetical protein